MSDLRHLKMDEPVRVFEINGHPPAGGWEGKVTSVGRRYLVVAFFRSLDGPEHEIRVQREDGRSPDQIRRFTVQTVEETEANVRRLGALEILRTVGLRYDGDHPRRRINPQLLTALADLVDEWGQEATL